MAIAYGCQEKALLYADTIWERHDQSLKPESARLLDAARVLAAATGREADAWHRLQSLTEGTKVAWLDMYRLAPKVQPALSHQERLSFLDEYLKPGKDEKPQAILNRHIDVVRLLTDEKAYLDALRYMDVALALPQANREPGYTGLLLAKGDCLACLGRKDEAKKTYTALVVPGPQGHTGSIAEIAKNRIAALDTTRVEE